MRSQCTPLATGSVRPGAGACSNGKCSDKVRVISRQSRGQVWGIGSCPDKLRTKACGMVILHNRPQPSGRPLGAWNLQLELGPRARCSRRNNCSAEVGLGREDSGCFIGRASHTGWGRCSGTFSGLGAGAAPKSRCERGHSSGPARAHPERGKPGGLFRPSRSFTWRAKGPAGRHRASK